MRRFLAILLLSVSTPLLASADSFWTPVSWTNPDGMAMQGLFRPPKPGRWTWVLLHGLGSNKEEWLDFGHTLGQSGDGVFIYDARGHGQSNRRMPDGSAVSYRDFATQSPESTWGRMPADLASAVDILKSRYAVP